MTAATILSCAVIHVVGAFMAALSGAGVAEDLSRREVGIMFGAGLSLHFAALAILVLA